MTRTRVIGYAICMLIGIVGGLYFRNVRPLLMVGLLPTVFILIAAQIVRQVLRARPLRRRVEEAAERDDADGVERALNELAVLWARSPRGLAAIEANRALVPLLRGAYDEAVALARRALHAPDARKQEATLLNNLAWALAHTAALDEAAEVGERALALATTKRLRSYANGTLGGVYALRGDPDRALRHLDDADAMGRGGAGALAARQYYRGVALESKRQMPDAVRAHEAARSTAPEALFGRKAAARLAALQSSS
jgi:tetratricopeptide (TPR) repeat protein